MVLERRCEVIFMEWGNPGLLLFFFFFLRRGEACFLAFFRSMMLGKNEKVSVELMWSN